MSPLPPPARLIDDRKTWVPLLMALLACFALLSLIHI